jgi:hypothetical protein
MSASHQAHSAAAVAILVAAAVLAVGASLMGTTEQYQSTESYEFDANDHPSGAAIVVTKREIGGMRLLGFSVRQTEYQFQVAFTGPESCWDMAHDDAMWPVANADCEGPPRLVGTISGSGRTATGESIVIVTAETNADCFAAVETGAVWPPHAEACLGP